MTYKYYGETYDVKLATWIKAKHNQEKLFAFRIVHFIKRLKNYFFNIRTVVLLLFCLLYYVLLIIYYNWDNNEFCYGIQILKKATEKEVEIFLLTFCIPTITSILLAEREREKALDNRYWEAHFILLNILSLVDSLKKCNNEKEIKSKLLEVNTNISFMGNNRIQHYGFKEDELKPFILLCIKIDKISQWVLMNRMEDIDLNKVLDEIEATCNSLQNITDRIWRKDTFYNEKILLEIEKDDIRIRQHPRYKIYVKMDDNRN